MCYLLQLLLFLQGMLRRASPIKPKMGARYMGQHALAASVARLNTSIGQEERV